MADQKGERRKTASTSEFTDALGDLSDRLTRFMVSKGKVIRPKAQPMSRDALQQEVETDNILSQSPPEGKSPKIVRSMMERMRPATRRSRPAGMSLNDAFSFASIDEVPAHLRETPVGTIVDVPAPAPVPVSEVAPAPDVEITTAAPTRSDKVKSGVAWFFVLAAVWIEPLYAMFMQPNVAKGLDEIGSLLGTDTLTGTERQVWEAFTFWTSIILVSGNLICDMTAATPIAEWDDVVKSRNYDKSKGRPSITYVDPDAPITAVDSAAVTVVENKSDKPDIKEKAKPYTAEDLTKAGDDTGLAVALLADAHSEESDELTMPESTWTRQQKISGLASFLVIINTLASFPVYLSLSGSDSVAINDLARKQQPHNRLPEEEAQAILPPEILVAFIGVVYYFMFASFKDSAQRLLESFTSKPRTWRKLETLSQESVRFLEAVLGGFLLASYRSVSGVFIALDESEKIFNLSPIEDRDQVFNIMISAGVLGFYTAMWSRVLNYHGKQYKPEVEKLLATDINDVARFVLTHTDKIAEITGMEEKDILKLSYEDMINLVSKPPYGTAIRKLQEEQDQLQTGYLNYYRQAKTTWKQFFSNHAQALILRTIPIGWLVAKNLNFNEDWMNGAVSLSVVAFTQLAFERALHKQTLVNNAWKAHQDSFAKKPYVLHGKKSEQIFAEMQDELLENSSMPRWIDGFNFTGRMTRAIAMVAFLEGVQAVYGNLTHTKPDVDSLDRFLFAWMLVLVQLVEGANFERNMKTSWSFMSGQLEVAAAKREAEAASRLQISITGPDEAPSAAGSLPASRAVAAPGFFARASSNLSMLLTPPRKMDVNHVAAAYKKVHARLAAQKELAAAKEAQKAVNKATTSHSVLVLDSVAAAEQTAVLVESLERDGFTVANNSSSHFSTPGLPRNGSILSPTSAAFVALVDEPEGVGANAAAAPPA